MDPVMALSGQNLMPDYTSGTPYLQKEKLKNLVNIGPNSSGSSYTSAQT
jgi:hypothetical protein